MFSFFVLCLLAALTGCGGSAPKTYSVTGKVTFGGEGLAGVSVSYSGGSVSTDENGEFVIENLQEATRLTAEKEGYVFTPTGVSVSSLSPSAEIEGFLCVDLAGRVESNALPVPGAFVKAEGLKGGSVYTDAEGKFVLSGVAGELTVRVQAEGYTFLDKVVEPGVTEVVFDGVYTATGRITSAGEPLAGVTVTDGIHSAVTGADGSYRLENVGAYATLTAEKEGFAFLPASVTVEKENNVADFAAYLSRTFEGCVTSGEKALAGAEISAEFLPEGTEQPVRFSAKSAEDGSYSLDTFGGVTPDCVLEGFSFSAEGEGNRLDFAGSFEVEVSVTSRGNPVQGAAFGNVLSDETGKARLSVQYGEELLPVKEGYHAESRRVEDFSELSFELDPLYDLELRIQFEGEPLAGVLVMLDGRELIAESGVYTFGGLWGTHLLTAAAEGYALTSDSDGFEREIDENSPSFVLDAQKYFDITGAVQSGGLSVSVGSVAAYAEGKETVRASVEKGVYSFSGLLGEKRLIFEAEGYACAPQTVTHEDSVCNFDVTYSISGRAVSGNLPVSGAEIRAAGTGQTAVTGADGSFLLSGLSGEVAISAEKAGYVFDGGATVVDPYATVLLDSTYSMTGIVFNREESGVSSDGTILYEKKPLADVRIFARSGSVAVGEPVVTGADGKFSLSGLRGRTSLFANSEKKIEFKPRELILTGAGNEETYYFEANAYQVAGSVTSGGLPVAGVKLVTSERTVTTDSEGNYLFGVLKSLVTIVPEKEGYVFEPASYTVREREDLENIDFKCTYSVSGRVTNGGNPLSGVEISLGGQRTETDGNGRYAFEGVSGAQKLSLTKEGYQFIGTFEIAGYESEWNFESTYEVSGSVFTGGIAVEGVTVSAGSLETRSGADGSFVLSGLSGSVTLSFRKEGYSFRDSSELAGYTTDICAEGSYTVSGRVVSGGVPVSNVKVTVGDEIQQTGADGTFFFYGVSGENEVLCAKTGYEFGSTKVSGYAPALEVNCTYSFLVIVAGSAPLEGVTVRGFGREVVTDAEGRAEFTGLSGEGVLTFEKAGYTIDPLAVNGYSDGKQVLAKFSLSGTVATGGIAVSGVDVTCGGKTAKTDSAGKFTFEGLTGTVTLAFSKQGYEFSNPGTFTEYDADISISATYSLVGSVFCEDGIYGGVTVTATYGDGESVSKSPDSSGKYSFSGLFGETRLKFEREGDFNFDFNETVYSEYMDLGVNNCSQVYSVTGKVTVSGIAVPGVTVKIGSKLSAVTGADGSFRFDSVSGNQAVTAEISTKDLDGKKYSITKQASVSRDKRDVSLAFDQKDYALAAIYRGFEILRSTSFRSEATGVAEPHSSIAGNTGNQNASAKKIRGKDGSLLLQSQNYGDVILGIDPRIGQQIYVGAGGAISFRRSTGDSIKTDMNASTFPSWTENGSIKDFDGVSDPNRLIAYGIDSSTATVTGLKSEGGKLTVNISLDKTKGTTDYLVQMKKRSGQEILSFEYVNLTFTFDNSGRLLTFVTNEKYNVKAPVGSAYAISNTTETFTYEDIATVSRPN